MMRRRYDFSQARTNPYARRLVPQEVPGRAAADAELRRALAGSREVQNERLESEAWVSTMEEDQWSESRDGSRGNAPEE